MWCDGKYLGVFGQIHPLVARNYGVTYLTDRRKERFPLLNEFGCRNTLLNSRPLCLREDFSRLGIQTARLQFTIESPEECARIARAFLSGAPLDGEFTNGLYKRGVE